MQYQNICPGTFLARPNRFIAHVEVEGRVEVCHVKNTGRCRELLVPGCRVYLEESSNPNRKTRFDLVAVEKERRCGPLLVNMDSQAPNKVFGEWAAGGGFRPGLSKLRPETTFGNSRFDYYWEDSNSAGFVEVKGVTLERDCVAYFPDAPTERGVKHITELIECLKDGYEAYILFVIQMKEISYMTPNDATHKAFGDALREAEKAAFEGEVPIG